MEETKVMTPEQPCMSAEIGELASALASAQAELSPAAKNAQNPHLKNRYADIAAVYEAIRETLPKHGLSVSQIIMPHESKARVRTLLMHKSGQWLASECLMPLDRNGGPQGMGSAITYARRYSLSAIVGVVSEDDDDAEAAQPRRQQQAQPQQRREPAQPRRPEPVRQAQKPQKPQGDGQVDMVTESQVKAIVTLFNRCGIDVREVRLERVQQIVGRQITSCKELTKNEASTVIDVLQNGEKEQW